MSIVSKKFHGGNLLGKSYSEIWISTLYRSKVLQSADPMKEENKSENVLQA